MYAIIIGLHATLLKFAAGGPQAWLVEACVEKCVRGWWTNLLYINNYAQDIYSPGQLLKHSSSGFIVYLNVPLIVTNPGEADCVNVSWYMAIDMQYFIITPIILRCHAVSCIIMLSVYTITTARSVQREPPQTCA